MNSVHEAKKKLIFLSPWFLSRYKNRRRNSSCILYFFPSASRSSVRRSFQMELSTCYIRPLYRESLQWIIILSSGEFLIKQGMMENQNVVVVVVGLKASSRTCIIRVLYFIHLRSCVYVERCVLWPLYCDGWCFYNWLCLSHFSFGIRKNLCLPLCRVFRSTGCCC